MVFEIRKPKKWPKEPKVRAEWEKWYNHLEVMVNQKSFQKAMEEARKKSLEISLEQESK